MYWSGIACPYCNAQINGDIMIVNGFSNTCKTIPFLPPIQTITQLEKMREEDNGIGWKYGKQETMMTETLLVNCFALTSLYIPCTVFSRLQVSKTAMDLIPMPLLRCFHQLIYIEQQEQCECEYENSYASVKDLVAESILKLRGIQTIQSTMNSTAKNSHIQQQLIEDVAIALLSCSPADDLR